MAVKLQIQEKLGELLTCLASVDSLVNCHVANFFTKNLWQSVIERNIRDEFLDQSSNLNTFSDLYLKFIRCGSSTIFDDFSALREFIVQPYSIGFNLGCLLTPTNLISQKLMRPLPQTPIIRDFMSDKKKHEVENVVPLVEMLAEHTNTCHILDIGGGKGYLGTTISRHSNLNILSLDSSMTTTVGAAKMEKKMMKKKRNGQRGVLCRETIFVTPDMDTEALLHKHFNNFGESGLLGLHTCGNLASTCCRLFVHGPSRWLLNVGCCYHLIDEEFSPSLCWSDLEIGSAFGFPMSEYLRQQNIKLGRNARMLAAHSLHRLARDGINKKSAMSLFYRAVLQVLAEKDRGHTAQEGNIGKLFDKSTDFKDYIKKAMQKLQLKVEVTDEEIESLWRDYADKMANLDVFFLLRVHFAPLIEHVILLDRLLYLHEQGIHNAYLVPIFDSTLSPRNIALVAWK